MGKNNVVLIILDGWGSNPDTQSNAIAQANTPTWDKLIATYPSSKIATSGEAVGLPNGQMGNSEVGHINIGAGRIVYQSVSRINRAIEDGSFSKNPEICNLIDHTATQQGALHILGLVSDGGVHSHIEHIKTACQLAVSRGIKKLYVHGFLDGRDTPPRSAAKPILDLEQHLNHLGIGKISTLIGRYFSMDRDNRWERIEKAYRLIAEGKAEKRFATAQDALNSYYQEGINDEFLPSTAIGDEVVSINPNDGVLFMNFRPDRSRALTRALVSDIFDEFERSQIINPAQMVTLTQYEETLPTPVAFPPITIKNSLGEFLATHNKRQLRIAETEKYAHVTFFFNGGQEQPYLNEERILIPSPKVDSYDIQPEMSAPEVTDKITAAIDSAQYDLIVCNYANGDMVGHTGNFNAAVKAVECLDLCLSKIVSAVLENEDVCLITADHGNVEKMSDSTTQQPHTAHTLNPVPLIYIDKHASSCTLRNGSLQDIAPTILALMHLTPPQEMEGKSLIIN